MEPLYRRVSQPKSHEFSRANNRKQQSRKQSLADFDVKAICVLLYGS
jgi:hypothetical protein